MYIDFHAHILPNLDDGAKDIETSIEMLNSMKIQGISTVVATPHYNSESITIDDFLERRNKSYSALIAYVNERNLQIPKILLGAEVLLSSDIAFSDEIYKLSIEGTNCILIEMPFGYWYNWVLDSIYTIINNNQKQLIPIIAHVERYVNKANLKIINSLLNMDVYAQVNASSFYNNSKNIVSMLYDANMIHVLGTDCHNTTTRSPEMINTKTITDKKYGHDFFKFLMKNSAELLDGKRPNINIMELKIKKNFFSFF